MIRTLAHYIKYLAIYFVLGQTFLLSSWEKWTSNGTPEWFRKQFEHTFLATIPGLSMSYYLLAALEGLVFLIVIVSLFMGDWRVERVQKNWLKLAIALGALTFGALGFGQNLTSDFTGAAQLFAYFGAALVIWLVVSADESAAARKALEDQQTRAVAKSA